jgi:plasmid stabilization system protein ParE
VSRTLIIRAAAEAELAEAFDWYDRQVAGLGAEFLLAADAVMRQIARAPQQYPKVRGNIRRALLRRFPFAVYFVLEPKRVVVLAFFHAKRDPRQWQTRS